MTTEAAPRGFVLRTLIVVALAVVITLGGTLWWTVSRERARIDEDLRARAARTADLAHVLLRQQIERGQALVAAIAASRDVQDALADRNQPALLKALQPFRTEFSSVVVVVDDISGRPLAWSNPIAIMALGVADSGDDGPRFVRVAGDLAVFAGRRVESAGRPLGRVRVAILTGRALVRTASDALDAPLAIVHDGQLRHHTFPADPPLPVGGAGEASVTTARVDEQEFEIAWRPVEAPGGTTWLAAGLARAETDRAFRRFAALVVASGGGGLAVVLVAVGLILRAAQQQERLTRQRDAERLRSQGLSERLAHLAAVVHDIKAPLGGIQLRCEGLLEDRPEAEIGAALAQIYETCDRLNLYLVNVLTAAQAEEGPIALRREVVLAGGLLEEVAERVRPLAERRRLRLLLEADPGTPHFRGDPVLLERALLNMASNAIAASPPGGTVALFARPRGGAVELGAWDTGPGFTAFAPADAFSRARPEVKDASLRTGTGLGLFIVARIAEAHGGAAFAENRAEGGASVHMTIPL